MPRHGSFEDKLACAARLREEAGIGRDILVDSLAGIVHRGYGYETQKAEFRHTDRQRFTRAAAA